MKSTLALACVVAFLTQGALSTEPEAEVLPLPEVTPDHLEAPPPLPIDSVRVRLLDKISCQFIHIVVQVGRLYAFGRLRFLITHAFKNHPEDSQEVFAFLKVWEKASPGEDPTPQDAPIFSGWMFASSPPVAPLEHPVYDLRVETEPFDRDPPKGSS